MNRINYPCPITSTLLEQRQEWVDGAILDRTQFLTGVKAGVYGYGIVDGTNPTTATEGSGRPFAITASDETISVNMEGGTVVFGNGELLELGALSTIVVPTVYLGERHVMYLQWSEEEHDVTPNDMDTPIPLWIGQWTDDLQYVRIARKVDYDALPTDQKRLQTVPLALLTPTNTGVIVDMTQTEMSTMRLWATPVDIEHRSKIGTGTVTSRNIHGLSISDLSVSSGSTLYDFMLPHGTIIAQDVGIAGVPGRICQDTIPPLGILQDGTGQTTGFVGAYYFSLSRFPSQIIQCVDATDSTTEIALVQIPNQNVCFFFPNDEWDNSMSLTVSYTAVDAAAPPIGTNLVTFTPSQPYSNETIVADGVVVSSVNGALSYATAGPYPFLTHVYMDAEGTLHRIPDTLKCDIQLTNAPGLQNVEIQPVVPCKIRIGMRSAVAGPTLSVQIRITGIEADSQASISEIVSFGSTWTDSAVPSAVENPNQWITTVSVFSSITNYEVITRLNDGPNSAITIQGMYDPNNIALADMLPVANVFWDGLRMFKVIDARPIRTAATSVQSIGTAASAISFAEVTMLQSLASQKAVVGAWYDDFEFPQWVGLEGTIASRWANGLGLGDVYRSRAIAVRPHTADGVTFRIAPIEPDQGYNGQIRFYLTPSNTWTAWLPMSGLNKPRFSYTFPAGEQLLKWQFQMNGPVKGIQAAYIAVNDNIPPTLIFDVGAYGVDSFG